MIQALFMVMITLIVMEFAVGQFHQHFMHGIGWKWHESHHLSHEPIRYLQSSQIYSINSSHNQSQFFSQIKPSFEKNDLYTLVFTGATLILFLVVTQYSTLWWIGVGISLYGFLYALMHDVIVHHRLAMRWQPRNAYLSRLIKAHHLHHAVRSQKYGVSFGFLYAPPLEKLHARLRAIVKARNLAINTVKISIKTPVQAYSNAYTQADGILTKAQLRIRVNKNNSLQAYTGLILATGIIGLWSILHIWAIFFLVSNNIWLTIATIIGLIWLSVGLFIIAHDAMHGSLFPKHRKIGQLIGATALMLYAGFSFNKLLPKHHAHHRFSGSALDPDFSFSSPSFALTWYGQFMKRYFGGRELIIMTLRVGAYLMIGASPVNILLFFALPGLLSSFQLFYFGTYLPHRHAHHPFNDHHNARSNQFGYLTSLLTCFHFGYHHEHHLQPNVAWWQLPALRKNITNFQNSIKNETC